MVQMSSILSMLFKKYFLVGEDIGGKSSWIFRRALFELAAILEGEVVLIMNKFWLDHFYAHLLSILNLSD